MAPELVEELAGQGGITLTVKKHWWQSWRKVGLGYEVNGQLAEAEECYIRAGSTEDVARVRGKLGQPAATPQTASSPAAPAGPAVGGQLSPFSFDQVVGALQAKGYSGERRSEATWYFSKDGEVGFAVVAQDDEATSKPSYLIIVSTFALEDDMKADLVERSRLMDILNYNCNAFHVFTDSDDDLMMTSACPVAGGFNPGLLTQLIAERKRELDKHQSLLWKLIK
jgi:hypothetical protein